ncbi:MAG: hypothetical protein AB7E04_12850 [Desulfobacteraceae bacterium]
MKRKVLRTLNLSGRLIDLKYENEDLKTLPKEYVVKIGENKYPVDLHSLSCICNDFTENRSKYPEGDIRRMCVHQVLAVCRYLKKNGSTPFLWKNYEINFSIKKGLTRYQFKKMDNGV